MQNKYNDLVNFIIWIYPDDIDMPNYSELTPFIKFLFRVNTALTHIKNTEAS